MVEKKNVLLVNAAGMSISLLAKKMDDYAEMNKLPYSVEGAADSVGLDKASKSEPRVILVAPQVRYLVNKYQKAYDNKIPVGLIDMVAYGMMDAGRVLKQVEALDK
ncbi:hypothetical protein ATX61_03175 [Oenococcus oeni]|uniref:PTS sugar transporter subunit IIB n=1 Tax=Oenococcus oeni TaxID=1247 RepID=UPI0008F8E99F|nr:hypothetical protein [Oenococcus oeni]OIM27071.1 hypothetical protein ATX61_03175 [Oenococcus oeni]